MMATYFNGGCSEIQADNLQTLYLMNPSYSADSQTPPGLLFHNAGSSAAHALNPGSMQHLVGVPLAPSDSANHYNLWGGEVNAGQTSPGDLGSPGGFRRPQQISFEHHHHRHQNYQQGLSLSLNNSPAHKNVAGASGVGSPTSGVSPGGGQGGVLGSKYMKVAQELLDEVVNVGKVMSMVDLGVKEKAKGSSCGGGESKGGSAAAAAELSTAQRQELQMKKAKLLNMLDDVEQRYGQYHSQMQMVASSYEQAAGSGSAKSYTALALHTISKQFRCLKDAIATQIKAVGRSLGEEEEGRGEGSSAGRSRLRLVDQEMRQQRAALQQLGMMQQHPHAAWRPQRGLPERAVSVLRAWLFEHFLHPYPKDSDKHTLAKQTGLTRSQVSNWFINARVRLWKPMVEEMYLEETKGAQHQNNPEEHTNNNDDPNKESPPTLHSPHITLNRKLPPPPSHSINDIPTSTIVSPPTRPTRHTFEPALQGFSLTGQPSSMMESSMMSSPKRQRSNIVADIQNNSPSSIISMDHHMGIKDNSRGLFSTTHHPGFGPNYPVGDQQLGNGQYNHGGNAVSLTLGLHHQQSFLPGQAMQLGRMLDIGIGEAEFCSPQPSHSGVGGGSYEGVDIQNRKRFAAQLLSDFVA